MDGVVSRYGVGVCAYHLKPVLESSGQNAMILGFQSHPCRLVPSVHPSFSRCASARVTVPEQRGSSGERWHKMGRSKKGKPTDHWRAVRLSYVTTATRWSGVILVYNASLTGHSATAKRESRELWRETMKARSCTEMGVGKTTSCRFPRVPLANQRAARRGELPGILIIHFVSKHYFFSGSSRMPSASSRLRASSRAQVCILSYSQH